MWPDIRCRANIPELMDDLTQPDWEFAAAYRELAIINRRLGGVRAIERFLPDVSNLLMLDVAAGACDIAEALLRTRPGRVVVLDMNMKGLHLARKAWPVTADAFDLPFSDGAFDVVMASLFFHHLSDGDCVRALREMWRVSKRRVLVNDLHRRRMAYASIRLLGTMFSNSRMVRHDGPASVLRAFRPAELLEIAKNAGIAAKVFRSFPYRLVLVAEK
jgi:ubiquinone/menaquinone biosynthesis C-methylase UbiE